MKWLAVLDRFKEPSTFAGLSGLALAFGLTESEYQVYANALAGLAALAAMIIREKSGDDQ